MMRMLLAFPGAPGDWKTRPFPFLAWRFDHPAGMSYVVPRPTGYGYADDAHRLRSLPTTVARGARSTEYSYDGYGRIRTEEDALGGLTTSTYTDTGLVSCLTQRVDPTGAETSFTCNQAGDVLQSRTRVRAVPGTAQSVEQMRTVDTVVDELGRVVSVTAPYEFGTSASAVTLSEYDAAGRLKKVTGPDPDGAGSKPAPITSYSYDLRGRVTSETFPDPDGTGPLASPEVDYTYEPDGTVLRQDERDKIWITEYDALNRVVSVSDPLGNEIVTNYSLAGKFVSVTDDAAVVTTTVLDALGRTVSERLGGLNSRTFTYFPSGQVDRVTEPSGAWTQFTYTAFGEVATEKRPTGDNGSSATMTYWRDAIGRVYEREDLRGKTFAFTHDAVGRVLTASLPDSLGTHAFKYDDAGERVYSAVGLGGQELDVRRSRARRQGHRRQGNDELRLRRGRPAGAAQRSRDARSELHLRRPRPAHAQARLHRGDRQPDVRVRPGEPSHLGHRLGDHHKSRLRQRRAALERDPGAR